MESGQIAVHESSPRALRIALNFIYAGRLEAVVTVPASPLPQFGTLPQFGGPPPTLGQTALPTVDLLGALALLRMFMLPAGVQLCRDAVLKQLTPASVIDTLVWADANADEPLRSASLAFALLNFAMIREAHPAALETLAAAPRDLMLEVLRGLKL